MCILAPDVMIARRKRNIGAIAVQLCVFSLVLLLHKFVFHFMSCNTYILYSILSLQLFVGISVARVLIDEIIKHVVLMPIMQICTLSSGSCS